MKTSVGSKFKNFVLKHWKVVAVTIALSLTIAGGGAFSC